MTDKLLELYVANMAEQGVSLSGAPQVMVLDNVKDRETIDSHVNKNFDPRGTIYGNCVDAFVILNSSAKCFRVSFLVVYDKKNGKSVYFHSEIDPKTGNALFSDFNRGEELYLHMKGRDFEDAMKRVNLRFPLRTPGETLRAIVSKEIENTDTWYESGGFHCIDFLLNNLGENGIHARPSSRIVDYVNNVLMEKGLVDEKNLVYISKRGGELKRADSISSVMLIGAGGGSYVSVCSKKKESASLLYDFVKNLQPED